MPQFQDKDDIAISFSKAGNQGNAYQLTTAHSYLERCVRDEFNMLKMRGNSAFLIYFQDEALTTKPFEITAQQVKEHTLAKVMRSILNQDKLAVVLDLRGDTSFEDQWPFAPGTVQSMNHFEDKGPLLPQQFQFFRKNMPEHNNEAAP